MTEIYYMKDGGKVKVETLTISKYGLEMFCSDLHTYQVPIQVLEE